jgi:cyanate lyase
LHREEATDLILEAKKEKGLTFGAIAEKVGRHKVWTTAALMERDAGALRGEAPRLFASCCTATGWTPWLAGCARP